MNEKYKGCLIIYVKEQMTKTLLAEAEIIQIKCVVKISAKKTTDKPTG